MENKKCTIVILTKDEENNLKRIFNNLRHLNYPVLVVDSGSTDKTKEVCLNNEALFVYNEFKNFCQQRNFALEYVNTEWILFLDADEILSEELKIYLNNFLNSIVGEDISAFSFNRKAIAFGKRLKYAWSDSVIRLLRTNDCKYDSDLLVHEQVITNGKVKDVSEGYIKHYTYSNFKQYLEKMRFYIELEGESLKEKDYSLLNIISRSLLTLLDRLFFKKWILDGFSGLHASFTSFVVTFLSLSLARSIKENGNIYSAVKTKFQDS
jgi:glycosyltransferase involved in cell wall biosynthesis